MPTVERFEVLVEGRVESKKPAFCECLRVCPRPEYVDEAGDAGGSVRGEAFRGVVSTGEWTPATVRAADTAVERVGREKFWRLAVLLLLWEVKLA